MRPPPRKSRSRGRAGVVTPSIRGSRLALRPLSEADIEGIGWYEGAEGLRGRLEDANCGVLAIIRREDGSAIGVVEYRRGVPEDGWLRVETIAVEPGRRGLGLESEAVRLVEGDAVRRRLAQRFWSGVRRDDGLGLYFWLRLGYRPTRPGDLPWKGDLGRDIMAMVRMAENLKPGPEVGS